MQYFTTFLALTAATTVLALPLNINLGAYSPALVVGDGEISFGGGEEAAALVNTLQGTAGTAAGIAAATAKGATTPSEVTTESALTTASVLPIGGIGKSVSPREPEAEESSAPAKEKRAVDERDLAGFNAALNFASTALTTSPGVELGTGEGGSGVGIIVKPGGKVTRDVADSTDSLVKREDGSGPTVTLLKIRTLGDRTSAKTRRGEEPERRAIEVDSDGNMSLNLDGEVEMVIAEVKA